MISKTTVGLQPLIGKDFRKGRLTRPGSQFYGQNGIQGILINRILIERLECDSNLDAQNLNLRKCFFMEFLCLACVTFLRQTMAHHTPNYFTLLP